MTQIEFAKTAYEYDCTRRKKKMWHLNRRRVGIIQISKANLVDDPRKYKIKKVFIHPILLLKADKFLIRMTIKHSDFSGFTKKLKRP